MKELNITTSSLDETLAFGRRLGALLASGDVIALCGELGAGKTYFTKGIAEGLGVEDTRTVSSPTFVLLKQYEGRVLVNHFDAYRLEGSEEFLAIGSDDVLGDEGVSIIEWADRVPGAMPENRLEIDITITGPESRTLALRPHGKQYEEILSHLM